MNKHESTNIKFCRLRGFTLIELILVIAIVGVLAVAVFPRIMDIRNTAAEKVVRNFEGTLNEARDLYYSRLYLENLQAFNTVGRHFMSYVAASGYGGDRNIVVINDSMRDLLEDPGADVMNSGNNQITFDLKGGASAVYTMDSATGAISASYTGF